MNRWIVSVALAFGVTVPGIAHADDAQPWAVGVTAQQKASAQKLLDTGNAAFLENKYAEALESYKAALGIWDHPAIRFNVVRCLILLHREVEASENLEVALKYGAAPLEEAVYTEALAYQTLLANQVGTVDVRCDQTGVELTLDGQALGTCPGVQSRRVAPGPHQLVGVKHGFVTLTRQVLVRGGTHAEEAVSLVPFERSGKLVHRWPAWIPWVVFGGGAAVVGMGGAIDLVARESFRDYDNAVASECPTGCASRPGNAQLLAQLASQKQGAQHIEDAAFGVMATGAAATAVGAVLLYMNRNHLVYADSMTPIVTPLPGGGGAVSIRGAF